ncbi:hypothetical protein BH09SUM1_BH09SUM1_06030 [soil metagenome]
MANVTDSLRTTEAKLDAQLSKARRSQKATLIGGIVIIALILGYFIVISSLLGPVEPDTLGEFLVMKAKPQVMEIGPAADKFVKEEAPKMIRDIMRDAVTEHIPNGRKTLQATIIERSTKALDELEAEINKSSDETITKYSSDINQFAELLRTDDGTEQVKDELYKMIDESVKDEKIMSDLDEYGLALKTLEGHVARLTSGDPAMSEDDHALFHLVAVVRELSSRSDLIQMRGVSMKVGHMDSDPMFAAPGAEEAPAMSGDKKAAPEDAKMEKPAATPKM